MTDEWEEGFPYLELTRCSGQLTSFTLRQMNEVLQNENGLVNGTLLRSDRMPILRPFAREGGE